MSELTYLAGEFSEIAELVSIGRSVEGREITGLKISTDVRRRADLKPQAVFSSSVMANRLVEIIIATSSI